MTNDRNSNDKKGTGVGKVDRNSPSPLPSPEGRGGKRVEANGTDAVYQDDAGVQPVYVWAVHWVYCADSCDSGVGDGVFVVDWGFVAELGFFCEGADS